MPLDKREIGNALTEKGAIRPCHRCGAAQFTVLDGYSSVFLQPDLGSVVLGGPNVPVASVVCNNCGAITAHAVGALGLLPGKSEQEE